MSNNVGLDFGTTYSVISYLRDVRRNASGAIEEFNIAASEPREGGHSPCQDSIVAVNEIGRTFVGLKARQKVDEDDVKVLKGFKMLLAEKNVTKLMERNYDENYTPEKATKDFISTILDDYISQNLNGESIDNLVVGVPEIWFSDASTIDCRTKLEEIIKENDKVKNVQLVSEPALACAYFTNNYKRNTGREFVGRLLLIDYGGGTLDVALCNVNQKGLSSEVSVIKRAGAGTNEEGLGKGGVLFLETVVNKTLIEAGISKDDIKRNNEYYKCVHDVEDALMINVDDIKDVFEEAEGDKKKIKERFKTITYDAKKCFVTYGILAQAYEEAIKNVLKETLKEMTDYMDENGINYRVNTEDNFKIALVGGFCNFYLTQNQIENTLGLQRGGAADKRYNDVIGNRRDCEKAISFGAALIANNIIDFKQLSPYTLSIVEAKTEGGNEVPGDAMYETILNGMEIEYGVPVMAKYEDGTEVKFLAERIPFLRVDFGKGMYKCGKSAIPINLEKDHVLKLGFSLDHSAIISLHVIDLGKLGQDFDPKAKGTVLPPIRLADIYSMFGGIIALEEEKK